MTLQISWATETESDVDGETVLTSAYHVLEFDAVTSEEHTAESDLTDHVVESAAAISDHKRPKPRSLSIEAIVSNTPLSFPPSSGFASSSVTAEIATSGPAKANVLTFSGEFDRIQDVEATLERLRSEAIDLTVETRVRTYDNVQLVSVSIPRADPVDAITIKLGLREVFRASTQIVDAPLPREPRGGRTTETAAEGEDDPDVDDSETSLLGQLLGGFG